jgi:hypothetical protein
VSFGLRRPLDVVIALKDIVLVGMSLMDGKDVDEDVNDGGDLAHTDDDRNDSLNDNLDDMDDMDDVNDMDDMDDMDDVNDMDDKMMDVAGKKRKISTPLTVSLKEYCQWHRLKPGAC